MSDNSLRIVFAGTPDFAAVALRSMLVAGHNIVAVYCQPDRPSGRGKKLKIGPVKSLAIEHQLPVEQPENFKSEAIREILASYQADVMVVVAYGLLLPESVLQIPRLGCFNIHGSLLPRWRGAAPIQRAIEAGDSSTGITIMQMDKGLDTGPMLLKKSLAIATTETGSSLHDKLAALGGVAIVDFLAGLDPQTYQPDKAGEAQNDVLATYAHKLSKKEAEIDWQQDGHSIERKIRAFNAWPVAYTFVGSQRMRIWQATLLKETSELNAGHIVSLSKAGIDVACGDRQVIRLLKVQPDGAKQMDAAACLNSRKSWFVENPQLGQMPHRSSGLGANE